MDHRHARRVSIVQELFAHSFGNAKKLSERGTLILKNLSEINALITQAAPKYDVSKIARVDLAILQLAVYELHVEKKIPPKVIINEAIELAKELASPTAPGFINAVLGALYELESKSEKKS